MSLMPYPKTHAEREQVIRATEVWRTKTPTELALALYTHIFAPAEKAYLELGERYQAAKGAERAASDAADVCDERFDTAMRKWTVSVRDERGVARTAELSPLLSMPPNELTRKPYGVEVSHTQRMLVQLENRPELRGDPAAFAELSAATNALAVAVAADEEATLTRLAIGREYTLATKEFDKAYRKLRRALVPLIGQEALDAAFPLFVRAEPKGD
ncbi:MAG: hypothetical protein RBU37_22525 [Myxococcota bacterium]|jgi:hypothetical protein|nr:hypothetical protein [Myxococcota bacterium]